MVAACFAACSNSSDEGGTTSQASHIYILTAAEDHGWTGSVATFAKEKAEEINNAGKYTAEVITASSASDQITKIEDIIAKGEKDIAVVVQPMDDTVQSAIQSLVDAGIPYVAFDRIIDAVSSSAVANVKGDNEGIGAGAAAYFVENGLPRAKAFTFMRAIHLQLQPFVTTASQSISPVNLHSTARLSPRIRNGQKKILNLSHIQAQ